MAGSFFALLDDIASLLDDIALMTKTAAQKTAGVLGDDLAVNAYQVSGMAAERELPVVWAVAKGSLLNKVILVPLALLLSAFLPAAINYVLLIGAAYLGFEGAEKIWHWLKHRRQTDKPRQQETARTAAELSALEKSKIQGAVKTDFILSAEIVVIALGELTAMGKPFLDQVIALCAVALLLTIGVYGTVAFIVKMDDIGYHWQRGRRRLLQLLGRGFLWFAPKLLRSLSILGTIAMFAVAGAIWTERLPWLEHHLHPLISTVHEHAGWLGSYAAEILLGALIGFIVLAAVSIFHRNKAHD